MMGCDGCFCLQIDLTINVIYLHLIAFTNIYAL